jgi:4-hydroxy-tetrahydrodipicolinate synthase
MFEGVYTALVTPFNSDGSIDIPSLKKLIRYQIDGGISGIVPMGTTGESPTLNHEDHIRIIELVVKEVAGQVPIIAGTGSNCTDEAIDMTKKAKALGIDASLQVAPYYNKPSQEGFYQHFSTIADKVDLPMIVYNIPSRSGKNIENSTMLRLAEHTNIVGVKEASGSLPQMMDLILNKPADFTVLSGDDNLGLPLILLGGKGIISVASNLIPDKMEELVKDALSGNLTKAKQLHYFLLPLFKGLFMDTNPIPIKYALFLKGLIQDHYRLPMCGMTEENKTKLGGILKQLKLL